MHRYNSSLHQLRTRVAEVLSQSAEGVLDIRLQVRQGLRVESAQSKRLPLLSLPEVCLRRDVSQR